MKARADTDRVRRRLLAGLAAALASGGCRPAPRAMVRERLDAPAFWVWHRRSPLGEGEREDLRAAGIDLLCWQIAELSWKDGSWHGPVVSPPQEAEDGPRIVPVLRIDPRSPFLGSGEAESQLAGWLRHWAGDRPLEEIQLDYDCPERLLARYALFVRRLGEALGCGVSLTALASWTGNPSFPRLAETASWLAPMFYDLEPDPPAAVLADRYLPLADPAAARWIDSWAACARPWRAGLANFERLSVFGADGSLVGHLRGWSHDAVFFHPALEAEPLGAGLTRLHVRRPFALDGVALEPAMRLLHRQPEAGALETLAERARLAGARGLIHFALPGPGIATSRGIRQLAAPAAPPALRLSRGPAGEIVLHNDGPGDLPPRALSPGPEGGPGWRLEIETAIGRGSHPGEFVLLEPAPAREPGHPPRLRLAFSRLAAGDSLASGPLPPSPDGEAIRWQLHGTPHQGSLPPTS